VWNEWVIDATLCRGDELLCFVPIENRGLPDESLIFGMNVLSSIDVFEQGKIVGIIHADGQEAADKWAKQYPQVMDAIKQITILETKIKYLETENERLRKELFNK